MCEQDNHEYEALGVQPIADKLLDNEDVDLFDPGEEPLTFPEESVAEVEPGIGKLVKFRSTPNLSWDNTFVIQGDIFAEATVEVDIEATCMHCGKRLGEFRKGQDTSVTHPSLVEGGPPHVLFLTADQIPIEDQNNDGLARIMGKWLRGIHGYMDPEDVRKQLMGELAEEKEAVATPPPPPGYTEVHPNEHLLRGLQQLIGSSIEQIASAIHMLEIMGPMEQMTFDLSDECGFAGSIVLQVTEVGNCDGYGQDEPGVPGSSGSSETGSGGVVQEAQGIAPDSVEFEYIRQHEDQWIERFGRHLGADGESATPGATGRKESNNVRSDPGDSTDAE